MSPLLPSGKSDNEKGSGFGSRDKPNSDTMDKGATEVWDVDSSSGSDWETEKPNSYLPRPRSSTRSSTAVSDGSTAGSVPERDSQPDIEIRTNVAGVLEENSDSGVAGSGASVSSVENAVSSKSQAGDKSVNEEASTDVERAVGERRQAGENHSITVDNTSRGERPRSDGWRQHDELHRSYVRRPNSEKPFPGGRPQRGRGHFGPRRPFGNKPFPNGRQQHDEWSPATPDLRRVSNPRRPINENPVSNGGPQHDEWSPLDARRPCDTRRPFGNKPLPASDIRQDCDPGRPIFDMGPTDAWSIFYEDRSVDGRSNFNESYPSDGRRSFEGNRPSNEMPPDKRRLVGTKITDSDVVDISEDNDNSCDTRSVGMNSSTVPTSYLSKESNELQSKPKETFGKERRACYNCEGNHVFLDCPRPLNVNRIKWRKAEAKAASLKTRCEVNSQTNFTNSGPERQMNREEKVRSSTSIMARHTFGSSQSVEKRSEWDGQEPYRHPDQARPYKPSSTLVRAVEVPKDSPITPPWMNMNNSHSATGVQYPYSTDPLKDIRINPNIRSIDEYHGPRNYRITEEVERIIRKNIQRDIERQEELKRQNEAWRSKSPSLLDPSPPRKRRRNIETSSSKLVDIVTLDDDESDFQDPCVRRHDSQSTQDVQADDTSSKPQKPSDDNRIAHLVQNHIRERIISYSKRDEEEACSSEQAGFSGLKITKVTSVPATKDITPDDDEDDIQFLEEVQRTSPSTTKTKTENGSNSPSLLQSSTFGNKAVESVQLKMLNPICDIDESSNMGREQEIAAIVSVASASQSQREKATSKRKMDAQDEEEEICEIIDNDSKDSGSDASCNVDE